MKNSILNRAIAITSIGIGAALLAPAALAQDALSFEGTAFVEKTVVEDGVEKVVQLPTDTVIPGDLIIFNTTYRNDGDQTVEEFVVTNPIPEPVALSDESAAALTVSVDGGETFGDLSTMSIAVEPEGERPATAADATHIRWTLDQVSPGESGTLSYKAFVR